MPKNEDQRRGIPVHWCLLGLAAGAVAVSAAFAVSITRSTTAAPAAGGLRAAPAEDGRKLAAATKIFPALPGVGARFRSQVPPDTSQVVVSYGDGPDQYTTTTEFFEKIADRWRLADTWQGHNGYSGWTLHKSNGDLKSPIGVFPLTDAGGELAKPPGTELPYQQSPQYVDDDKGFFGESLLDAFDYVIAIGYNRVPGTSPMSTDYPLGAEAGTGVWLHIDHGGPTHACVSIPEQGMHTLLEKLDPADHPVIVMGDRASLASD